MFTEIDLDTWPGGAMYRHFGAFDIPYFSVSTEIEVSAPVEAASRRGWSFFSLCLFGIVQALDAVEAFRCRVLADGRVVRHQTVETRYIIPRPDRTLTSATAPFEDDFDAFCLEQKRRERLAREAPPAYYTEEERGVVFLSCVPWMPLTAVTHPCDIGAKYDSIPRLTLSRYTRHPNGRVTMPFDLHLHHGFVDGYQVAIFLEAVRSAWDGLLGGTV